MSQIVLWGVLLGVGTFGYRFAGVMLRSRLQLSDTANRLLNSASVILLVALIATSTLIDGSALAGWARPAGVAVGGLLAWRRAPFITVVLGAAAAAAALRLIGIH